MTNDQSTQIVEPDWHEFSTFAAYIFRINGVTDEKHKRLIISHANQRFVFCSNVNLKKQSEIESLGQEIVDMINSVMSLMVEFPKVASIFKCFYENGMPSLTQEFQSVTDIIFAAMNGEYPFQNVDIKRHLVWCVNDYKDGKLKFADDPFDATANLLVAREAISKCRALLANQANGRTGFTQMGMS
jgi:hypothetical protein